MQDHFSWLRQYPATGTDAGIPTPDTFLPRIFDQYFLIGWNWGIIENFPFDEFPEASITIAQINERVSILRRFGLFLCDDAAHLYTPVSIKALAERFQVPYSINTLNHIKKTPGITGLSGRTAETLLQLVTALAAHEPLFLYLADDSSSFLTWEPHFGTENQIQQASDYIRFLELSGFDETAYLFPQNKDWCLVTIEGYEHIILAINRNKTAALQLAGNLEYFETGHQLRCSEMPSGRRAYRSRSGLAPAPLPDTQKEQPAGCSFHNVPYHYLEIVIG
jgi:hypothetical protein